MTLPMTLRKTSTLASAVVVAALMLAPGITRARTQATAWLAAQRAAMDRSEKIMAEANTRPTLLGQYRAMMAAAAAAPADDCAFNLIFSQYLSWYQTFVGDYPNAQISYSVGEPAQPGDAPSPLLGGWHAEPATTALTGLARGYQAVFFNEAHNVPLTRTLTVQMLAPLRKLGFDWFAVETLYHTDPGLQKRGYATAHSGFYTREPIYAEMVRTALRLGYKVIAYEDQAPGSGDPRERAQAQQIYDQVFKRDPKARLVVNAGYAHIKESGLYLGGRSMAQHLEALSGIDALTVEQTMLTPHPQSSQDHPWYTAVMARPHPVQPFVFVDGAGRPWSLRKGYDVSVFFPPATLRRERPDWLALGGLRRPYFVSGADTCRENFPCLVEAFYQGEDDDAVAADRMLFDPPPNPPPQSDRLRAGRGATSGELWLRPGVYRLRLTGADARILLRRNITVRAGKAGAAVR